MKKKTQPKPEPVVPAELLERAKLAISPDRAQHPAKCSVCGSESSGVGSETLCWVCRRLKISAWHENEQQMPVQE